MPGWSSSFHVRPILGFGRPVLWGLSLGWELERCVLCPPGGCCIFMCVLTVFDLPDTAAWISSPCLLMFSQVCLFLKRGASQTEVDEQGHDPLSIAVQAANADIVTLWVLFTLLNPQLFKVAKLSVWISDFFLKDKVCLSSPPDCAWHGWTRRCGRQKLRWGNQVNTTAAAPQSSSIGSASRSLSASQ